MVKAPCCEKVRLKRGKWTNEEDELLVKYIQANGEGSWRSLPKNAGLLRCGKSCRLRWTNYLRPNLKRGKFTAEEDETIVKLHSSLGNRWSSIAQHLSGRTDNEIENYWTSNLRRRIYTFRNFKELIKTTTNVSKIAVDGDCNESSRKRATTTRSKGGSIGSFLQEKNIVDDIDSSRNTNSSLSHSKGDTIMSEGGSIESLLREDNIFVHRGFTRKNDSVCLGSKDRSTWSEGDSIESLLPKNYSVDIGSIRKSNALCPGVQDDATWSRVDSIYSLLLDDIETNTSCSGGMDNATWSEEGGSFESLLLENIETNSSCPGGTSNSTWSEGGSIESFLLESYIIDKGSDREINSSCLGGRDETMGFEKGSSTEYLLTKNYIVDIGSIRETTSSRPRGKDITMWYEEWSSIESLSKNYIVDLEFLNQSFTNDIKGLAMQQHELHAKSEIHEPRSEEEEEDHIHVNHVIPKQQVCNGIWTFEDQGQQIQGPHEQNEENEIVLLQQHNECLHKFDNNWSDINFDYFLEEENMEFRPIEECTSW